MDSLVTKAIKEKLNASNGKSVISLYSGKDCDLKFDSNKKGLVSSKIPIADQLQWDVFDAVVEIAVKMAEKLIRGMRNQVLNLEVISYPRFRRRVYCI